MDLMSVDVMCFSIIYKDMPDLTGSKTSQPPEHTKLRVISCRHLDSHGLPQGHSTRMDVKPGNHLTVAVLRAGDG
jgi:hypothetical protein